METTQRETARTFKITGSWETQSEQLKVNFKQLTDADLKFETGKENELLTRIETRLYMSREDVIDIIKKNQPEKVQDVPRRPSRSL